MRIRIHSPGRNTAPMVGTFLCIKLAGKIVHIFLLKKLFAIQKVNCAAGTGSESSERKIVIKKIRTI